VDAKTKYEVNKARITWEQQAQQRLQNQELQKKETELYAKIQRGFEKYEDFEDVALSETVPITPVIKEILGDCEAPEDVAYYLGKNRTEAIRISHMTPLAAARAIAKIELELSTKPVDSPPPTTPKTTKAPPPIKPLGSAHEVGKDPSKMSQKEYEAWREAQGAKRF